MGALTSDFPNLPADADPNRVTLYAKVYADLTALGLALPGTASSLITRAALLTHLQGLAGQMIKDDLNNDQQGLDIAGADASIRNQFCNNLDPNINGIVYTLIVGSTTTIITFVGGAFDLIPNLVGASIKFKKNTPTAALQTVVADIQSVTASTITLTAALPVAAAIGDKFKLIDKRYKRRARINELFVGLPYTPNDLTTADITAAKV